MYAIKLLFIGALIANIMLRIRHIDKVREPITKVEAMVGLVLDSILIYLLLN